MSDAQFMRLALRLARRGYGSTSPNPMVGAVLVKAGRIIGQGWHRGAGLPHAEIEAFRDAGKRGHNLRGATLYVTLEPCCTHGRTPPCTEAIIGTGIQRVIVGAVDPNPRHAGKGLGVLKRAGLAVTYWGEAAEAPRPGSRERSLHQNLADQCTRLNDAFNHWIVQGQPLVTVKAALTLDGKIATAGGESKWITGAAARARGMQLRLGHDAILVGINTILVDDPSLTVRRRRKDGREPLVKPIRRIVLDSRARTPLTAKVVRDEHAAWTTIVVSRRAPQSRVAALARRVKVLVAPSANSSPATPHPSLDLRWLVRKLGAESVTSLLIEGGGEVNASFLLGRLAQRVAFCYAPKILGGRTARRAVAGEGVTCRAAALPLHAGRWRRSGTDLWLEAEISARPGKETTARGATPKAVW